MDVRLRDKQPALRIIPQIRSIANLAINIRQYPAPEVMERCSAALSFNDQESRSEASAAAATATGQHHQAACSTAGQGRAKPPALLSRGSQAKAQKQPPPACGQRVAPRPRQHTTLR